MDGVDFQGALKSRFLPSSLGRMKLLSMYDADADGYVVQNGAGDAEIFFVRCRTGGPENRGTLLRRESSILKFDTE